MVRPALRPLGVLLALVALVVAAAWGGLAIRWLSPAADADVGADPQPWQVVVQAALAAVGVLACCAASWAGLRLTGGGDRRWGRLALLALAVAAIVLVPWVVVVAAMLSA